MSEPSWQQRQYSDHLGNPVFLEEYVEPDWTPEEVHQVPIQVYSTVPLDDDHENLRDYLLNSFWDEEVKPLFEIYSYRPPDAYACMEHHRREIAYRKQQHSSGAPNPPPLIPQFFYKSYESPAGCCILLRSQSYRLGYIEDPDEYAEAGEAPDLLYFNRTFSNSRSSVDLVHRTSSAEPDPDEELYPEGFEFLIEPVRNQGEMGQVVMQEIFPNAAELSEDRNSLQYAADVDEGAPPDPTPPPEAQIQQQLDQQFAEGGFSLDDTFRVSHDQGRVTVTNAPSGTEPDLQYLIYAPFLSHLQASASALLERTARLFTAALISHLPPSKTVNLHFHIPASASPFWSAIHPAHRAALALHGPEDLPIGALQTFSADESPATPHRVSPQRRPDTLGTARISLARHHRVFAVVLDRPTLVSEAGVYFYMTDYDNSNDPVPTWPERPDTEVWRSAGMREVARRLGMLAVEEAMAGVETRTFVRDAN
ncbi:uncharacterized protein BJX67DRAFT_378950 [Aspergillus lucknowensis]|uniref:Uncharacterized protein n=1 Tax=Aspergillus lucknowensis TaxID=176173 RepID=A0ABR4LZE6_9EURO